MGCSGMLIGVGQTGVRAVQRAHEMWLQVFGTNPSPCLLGLDFYQRPQGFLESDYFQFPHDPRQMVDFVKDNQDALDHLAPWFDVDTWLNRPLSIDTLPRAVERMIFVQEIARGSDSDLFRKLNHRFQQIDVENGSPQIFIVGNIGEVSGSSLLIDVAHLVHQFGRLHYAHTSSTVHAYVLIPKHDTSRRVTSALQELTRFAQTVDIHHGYPFFYRPAANPSGQTGIWRERLTVKPFDHWSIYDDAGAETIETIATSIFVRLQPALKTRLKVDSANLASRTLGAVPSEVTQVNTENAFALAFPMKQIQDYWQQKIVLSQFEDLLAHTRNEAEDASSVFWDRFPNPDKNVVRLLLRETINLKRGNAVGRLDDRVRFWDGVIFPAVSGLGRRASDIPGYSYDLDELPATSPKEIGDAYNHLKVYLRKFSLNAPDNSPYMNLLGKARHGLLDMFEQLLLDWLYGTLKDDPAQFGLCLHWLRDLARRVRLAREQMVEYQKRVRMDYDAAFEENQTILERTNHKLKALIRDTSDNTAIWYVKKFVGKDNKFATLEETYLQYRRAVKNLVGITRLHQQTQTVIGLLEDIEQVVKEHRGQFERWYRVLQDGCNLIRPKIDAFGDMRDTKHFKNILGAVDAPWIQDRLNTPLMEGADLAWTWEGTHKRVLLRAGHDHTYDNDQPRLPQTLVDTLTANVGERIAQALNYATLPNYIEYQLNEQGQSVFDQIMVDLEAAETDTLDLVLRTDTGRSTKGYLLVPKSHTERVKEVIAPVKTRLKSRHQEGISNEQRISIVDSDHQMLLAYLTTTQIIAPDKEVAVIKRLRQRYWNQATANDHIFAADQQALRISQWVRKHEHDARTYTLSSDVSSCLLHTPKKFLWVAVGYVLQGLDPEGGQAHDALDRLQVGAGDGKVLLDAFATLIHDDTVSQHVEEHYNQVIQDMLAREQENPLLTEDEELSKLWQRTYEEQHTPAQRQVLKRIVECSVLRAGCQWLVKMRERGSSFDKIWFDIHTACYVFLSESEQEKRGAVKQYRGTQSGIRRNRRRR